MNINEFRIVENAFKGFYIQRLFKKEVYKRFLFWVIKKEVIEEWKNIDARGNKPYYSSFIGEYINSPMTSFTTKENAVTYIEKLCTPNKFHYPDGLFLAIHNNLPGILKDLKK